MKTERLIYKGYFFFYVTATADLDIIIEKSRIFRQK
jgi:hypothetical protein